MLLSLKVKAYIQASWLNKFTTYWKFVNASSSYFCNYNLHYINEGSTTQYKQTFSFTFQNQGTTSK